MKGSCRVTAYTLNYVSSHRNKIFGISDSNFKDPEYHKMIPAVQALLANQSCMFDEGVNFHDRHSVVCQHRHNHCTHNVSFVLFYLCFDKCSYRNYNALDPSIHPAWRYLCPAWPAHHSCQALLSCYLAGNRGHATNACTGFYFGCAFFFFHSNDANFYYRHITFYWVTWPFIVSMVAWTMPSSTRTA